MPGGPPARNRTRHRVQTTILQRVHRTGTIHLQSPPVVRHEKPIKRKKLVIILPEIILHKLIRMGR